MPSDVLLVAQPLALLLGMSHRLSYVRPDGGFGQLHSDFEDPDPALNKPKHPNIQNNVRVEEGI